MSAAIPVMAERVPLAPLDNLFGDFLKESKMDVDPRIEPARTRKQRPQKTSRTKENAGNGPVANAADKALLDADAALNSLRYYGQHTQRSQLALRSTKEAILPFMETAQQLDDSVLEAALVNLEEAFVADYRRAIEIVWKRGLAHGAWLREGEVRANQEAQSAAALLRKKVNELEEQNSLLQRLYTEAAAEIMKLKVQIPNQPIEEMQMHDDEIKLEEMEGFINSLFNDDDL